MVQFKLILSHLKESGNGRNVQELTKCSGCADTFTFVDVDLNTKLFTYLGSHFLMNIKKTVSGHYYAWITHIGESELAKDFTVEMTLGKDWPTRMHHRGKVFPISASWEDIRNETNGVLIFATVPNGQGFFGDDGDGNTIFEIFVEFLLPVKKDERDKAEADNTTTSLIKQLTYDFENEMIMYGDEVVKMTCELCNYEIPISEFKQHVKRHSWVRIETPEVKDIGPDSDLKKITKKAYPERKSNVVSKGFTTTGPPTSSNSGGKSSALASLNQRIRNLIREWRRIEDITVIVGCSKEYVQEMKRKMVLEMVNSKVDTREICRNLNCSSALVERVIQANKKVGKIRN